MTNESSTQGGAPAPRADRASLKSFLEMGSKVAAAIGALAYGCGLVVLHLYLQKYGVNTLGFFAPQYVAAGLWAVTFVGYSFATGCAVRFVLISEQEASHSRSGRWRPYVESACMLLLLFGPTLGLRVILDIPVGWRWLWPALLPLGLGFLLAPSLGPVSSDTELTSEARVRFRPELSGWWLALGAFATVMMLMSLLGFSDWVYPSIPARWGGGAPARARVLVSAAEVGHLREVKILADSLQGAIVGKLLLLTDDDVLLLPDRHTRPVLLRRSAVLALVLEPSSDTLPLGSPRDASRVEVDSLDPNP
jgi:hypothetical protein